MGGGYQFNGNAEDVFREFFGAGAGGGGFANLFAQAAMNGGMGGGSPFVFSMGAGGPRFSGGRGGGAGAQRARETALPCTLEELYRGARKRAQAANGSTHDIEIRPGWKAGTKIDYGPGAAFVVTELPHAAFTRAGNDLSLWREVRPAQILTGSRQQVKTLDGRIIHVEFAPLMLWTVRAARQARRTPRQPSAYIRVPPNRSAAARRGAAGGGAHVDAVARSSHCSAHACIRPCARRLPCAGG